MTAGRWSSRPPARDSDRDGPAPRLHRLVLERPVDTLSLFVEYEGSLWQDVDAGEKPGQIHNFEMHAHLASNGVYLADGLLSTRQDPCPELPRAAFAPRPARKRSRSQTRITFSSAGKQTMGGRPAQGRGGVPARALIE